MTSPFSKSKMDGFLDEIFFLYIFLRSNDTNGILSTYISRSSLFIYMKKILSYVLSIKKYNNFMHDTKFLVIQKYQFIAKNRVTGAQNNIIFVITGMCTTRIYNKIW